MSIPPRRRACITALLAAAPMPAAAQTPEPGLPRVLYGTPSPQVFYGTPSAPEPAPPPRAAPQPAPSPPPQSSLSFESGPAYLPPAAWWGGQPGWDRPPRPVRPPPPNPPRYVSPQGGMFEPPLPQGRYVGRPPSAPPEWRRDWSPTPAPPMQGRPPGR